MTKTDVLIGIYKNMSEAQLQEEIDAFLDIGFALLEATESDKIESFPNPNIKISFSCEVLKNSDGKYFC